MKYYVEHERTVEVWGKRHTISVSQTSKSVWVAVGDYMGKRIEVKDRSEGSAIKQWCEAARYKGNL
ncbi:MAG TPA: hypothetical protein VFB68_21630 [Xanthobacteraceae bacterium]|jgi:hypothetical protein|nr:hypothetical protein [Xanthobacteraceae bacterium]